MRHEVFSSLEAEAEFVGYDIRDRGLAPSDCVVLGRTNRLVLSAAEGLRNAGQEAIVPMIKSDFDSPVLGVLVEALRLANSRHDRVVLRRICREWERLTGVVLEPAAVGAAAVLVGGDFLRAWVDVADGAGGGSGDMLARIRADLVDRLNFPEVVDRFLETGWRSWGSRDVDELTAEEIATWKALHRRIVAEHGSRVTLNAYLQHFDLSSKTPPPGPNAVQCMTVHQSKGLEFKHVYLIGMAQEVFPSYRALEKGPRSEEVEEERRSCFVAITRARETLTLTRAVEYFGYAKRGKAHPAMPPPRFLREDDGPIPRRGQFTTTRANRIDGRRRVQEALLPPADGHAPHPPTRPRMGRQGRLLDPSATADGAH